MHVVRYLDGTPGWGVRRGDTLYPLDATSEGTPSYQQLATRSYRRKVQREIDAGRPPEVAVESVTVLAPVPTPGKIVCVGLNYHDHAEEQGEDPPDQPVLFGKAPTAVTDPGAPIVTPAPVDQLDYEVELAVVIGRTASNVAAPEAREYVAGYTVLNDVSARDVQFEDGQFLRGKSYDTFAPMGPALVAGDDIEPNDLALSLAVNGTTKQQSTTAEFVFDVDELIEFISHAMTLRPGDVISTGTPGGVGIFRDPPDLLDAGDTVEARIESVGTLVNPVV